MGEINIAIVTGQFSHCLPKSSRLKCGVLNSRCTELVFWTHLIMPRPHENVTLVCNVTAKEKSNLLQAIGIYRKIAPSAPNVAFLQGTVSVITQTKNGNHVLHLINDKQKPVANIVYKNTDAVPLNATCFCVCSVLGSSFGLQNFNTYIYAQNLWFGADAFPLFQYVTRQMSGIKPVGVVQRNTIAVID